MNKTIEAIKKQVQERVHEGATFGKGKYANYILLTNPTQYVKDMVKNIVLSYGCEPFGFIIEDKKYKIIISENAMLR